MTFQCQLNMWKFLYRPPSVDYNVALDKLRSVLDYIISFQHRKSVFICGDLNINVSKGSRKPDYKAFMSLCRDYNLTQSIDIPTRYSASCNSILDIFVSDSTIISQHGTIDYNISDHLPIYIIVKKTKEHYTKTSFVGRSYHFFSKDNFQADLMNINWGRFYGTSNINEAWDIFINYLITVCDNHAPTTTFYIRRDHPPWFNDDIIELCANRDFLFSLGRRTHNQLLINEANKIKNFIKHVLPRFKSDYYNSELENDKHDPKKYWRHMNSILNKMIR